MISIVIPTRGRPKRLKDTWDSIFNTASKPSNIEVVIAVDDDDPEAIEGANLLDGMAKKVVVMPREYAVPKWAAAHKSASGDILMLCGDDIIFRTPDWDLRVAAEFAKWPDRIGLVCVAEGIWNGQLATNIFLSREWINALGYFVGPGLRHNYVDQWLDEIAKAIERRVYIGDIMAEHIHPMKHPGVQDATYQIQEEILPCGKNIKQLDKEYFHGTEATQMRNEGVWKLRDAIKAAALAAANIAAIEHSAAANGGCAGAQNATA